MREVKLDVRPHTPAVRGPSARRVISMDGVWAASTVLVPMLVALLGRMVAIDLAYHIRAGELILNNDTIPRVDTFTFTMSGRPWLDQQWGAQVLLALAHRVGGFASLGVLRAALIGLAFGLLYRTCRARGARPQVASLLSLGGFVVSLQTLALRPQLFALPLFAGELLLLANRRAHPRRVWLIPVLALIWTSVHGSFVLAPAIVGLAVLEDVYQKDRAGAGRLMAVGIAALVATFVNPFGPGVWTYAFSLSTNPIIRKSVTEWAPIDLGSFAGVAFFATAAAIAGWLALRGVRTPWPWLVWLGTFFFLTLPAGRGVIWWGLVAPMAVAAIIASAPGSAERAVDEAASPRGDTDRVGSPLMNVAVVGTLIAASLVALPYWRDAPPTRLLNEAPQGLVNAAAAEIPPGAHLVVPQPWGSWFEYALPDVPVFVDPRIELFPAAVWDDYTVLRHAGAAWPDILDRWNVDAIVIDTRDWPLADEIAKNPGWRLAYEDGDGVLYLRS
jgi:hypothetical protein